MAVLPSSLGGLCCLSLLLFFLRSLLCGKWGNEEVIVKKGHNITISLSGYEVNTAYITEHKLTLNLVTNVEKSLLIDDNLLGFSVSLDTLSFGSCNDVLLASITGYIWTTDRKLL